MCVRVETRHRRTERFLLLSVSDSGLVWRENASGSNPNPLKICLETLKRKGSNRKKRIPFFWGPPVFDLHEQVKCFLGETGIPGGGETAPRISFALLLSPW